MDRKNPGSHDNPFLESNRRDFLKSATTVAAGLAVPKALEAEPPGALPTVSLGPHRVTRLIVGSNPIRGYSHFNPITNQQMVEWYTDERAAQMLLDCQKAGINTFQSSYFQERWVRIWDLFHQKGGQLHWICLTSAADVVPPVRHQTAEWVRDGQIAAINTLVKYKPIAMVHHGGHTGFLWRAGKLDYIKDHINKAHDVGCLAGISTVNPQILTTLEEKGFANDFYMAGLHNNERRPEEWMKEIGTVPVDEGWIASDPPRMAEAVRQVKKPVLVYKVLAAGRKCQSEEQKQEAIAWAYKNIKPIDATIIGLYPRYSDQVTETVQMVQQALA
jgi:hypothetical protein